MEFSGVRISWLMPDDVARLGDVGGFGGFLRLLQRGVGAFVRLDFVHQHGRLARGLGFGGAPALMRQHDHPGGNARARTDSRK